MGELAATSTDAVFFCQRRHPKQQEREKNHKEALKQEGSMFNKAEDAYKSLW